jgi:hypothetical protein
MTWYLVKHKYNFTFTKYEEQMDVWIALPGCHWPRLLRSQYKRPWLKMDLEKYSGDLDSDEENAKVRERGRKTH